MDPIIVLPPSLKPFQSPAGSHHLGLKALFYGPPKSGKSFALASFPSPIFALACGENGIELYLHPERGDVSVFIGDAKTYTDALSFALKHPKIASIVIDSVNLAFEDWLTSWEDTLGVEEIKGGNWKKVKGPWKTIHRQMMLSNKHVGLSAWPRGAKYINEETPSKMPGAEPSSKLVILEQDSPHVEKMLPFAVDMTLKTEIELDKRFAPTSIHRITYMGGRRPVSIPANELYTGKFWRFDSKSMTEQSPFDKVLKPIIEKWQHGAVEYVGLDQKEGEREVGEAHTLYEDQLVGSCLASLTAAVNLEALKQAWSANEAAINGLPPAKRAIITAAKDGRKKELGQ
jgi:hypothetical protein